MLQPDMDFLFLQGERNAIHLPGPFQTEKLGEEIDVTHTSIPP
jgi:hypothetical protein